MILHWPLKKKGPKGRRGQEFRAHTYPTVSSRPRGRGVQSLVQIGSEMWICIRYIHTYIHKNKQTNKYSSLYIRYNIYYIHYTYILKCISVSSVTIQLRVSAMLRSRQEIALCLHTSHRRAELCSNDHGKHRPRTQRCALKPRCLLHLRYHGRCHPDAM